MKTLRDLYNALSLAVVAWRLGDVEEFKAQARFIAGR